MPLPPRRNCRPAAVRCGRAGARRAVRRESSAGTHCLVSQPPASRPRGWSVQQGWSQRRPSVHEDARSERRAVHGPRRAPQLGRGSSGGLHYRTQVFNERPANSAVGPAALVGDVISPVGQRIAWRLCQLVDGNVAVVDDDDGLSVLRPEVRCVLAVNTDQPRVVTVVFGDILFSWCNVSCHCSTQERFASVLEHRGDSISAKNETTQQRVRSYLILYSRTTIKPIVIGRSIVQHGTRKTDCNRRRDSGVDAAVSRPCVHDRRGCRTVRHEYGRDAWSVRQSPPPRQNLQEKTRPENCNLVARDEPRSLSFCSVELAALWRYPIHCGSWSWLFLFKVTTFDKFVHLVSCSLRAGVKCIRDFTRNKRGFRRNNELVQDAYCIEFGVWSTRHILTYTPMHLINSLSFSSAYSQMLSGRELISMTMQPESAQKRIAARAQTPADGCTNSTTMTKLTTAAKESSGLVEVCA